MSDDRDDTRRVTRLLRWYPTAWRERYGDEFSVHLEQEFAARSVDFGRTVNIVRKGLVARVADLGLSKEPASEGLARTAIPTSFVLSALIAILALNFWSQAMLRWSSRTYHPIPVSATTGILAVVAALLVLVLAAIVVTLIVSVVRQFIRGRGRPLVGPTILAAGSGAVILYAARGLPRLLGRYGHLFQGGVRWAHPGPAMYGLAAITNDLTNRWVSMWNSGLYGTPTTDTVVNDLVPLAVLVFGVAVALLLRRVDLPAVSERFASTTVALLGALVGLCVITYVAWLEFGGPSGSQTFWPIGPWGSVSYLVFMALVAVLLTRRGVLAKGLGRTSVSR
jgi:hypothetical protein